MQEKIDIKKLREEKGLSQQELADLTAIPKGRINAWEQRGAQPKTEDYLHLTKFFNEYKSVQSKKVSSNIIHAPSGKFPKKIGLGSQPVPYFDVDFTAGDIEVYDDNHALQPAYMMDIPEFSGCTAFRVFSNSMERMIISGSILFGTKVNDWNDHLEYGQIYGIVCNDKRRYLKYIRKAPHKDETHFLLKSENVAEFDDFLMPKNKIKSIWLIHGWLNKRN